MDWGYLQEIVPSLLEGAFFTLCFFAVVFVTSILLSTALNFVISLKIRSLKLLITGFTGIIRGTPLLFQLYFVYFGLPLLLGIKIEPLAAGFVTFILSWSAYLTEIIRGSIQSIDRGQIEAGLVLGLSRFQILKYIILPQALVAALPALNNEAVSLVYGTSLLSVLGLNDILKAARIAVIRDFRLEAFALAAIIYAIIGGLIILIFKRTEKYFCRYKLKV
jgi:polar amino acid transport system permease protein